MDNNFERAQDFVGNPGGNFFIVGALQLELLKRNGCQPIDHVLDIGCGCLVAGRPIMDFLEPDRYVGIEPNTWLIDAVKKELPETADLIERKRPIFLSNEDFDASGVGRQFNFVISHSILSHAADWQLPLFLRNAKKVLAPGGVIVASIRFFNDQNELVGDSKDENWVYPGVSFFSWETVQRAAAEAGLQVEWRRDYRAFFTQEAPSNYHDWIRLTHEGQAQTEIDVERGRELENTPVLLPAEVLTARLSDREEQIQRLRSYLAEVEKARDWHAQRAEMANQQLSEREAQLREPSQAGDGAITTHSSEAEPAHGSQGPRAEQASRGKAQIEELRGYLAEVERARDWQADRVKALEEQLRDREDKLGELAAYLKEVEKARDWHAERAAALEKSRSA